MILPASLQEYTVEEIASILNLKPLHPGTNNREWYGPNPIGAGATEDGFILYMEGNAHDRKAEANYTSRQVAAMPFLDT